MILLAVMVGAWAAAAGVLLRAYLRERDRRLAAELRLARAASQIAGMRATCEALRGELALTSNVLPFRRRA